MSAAEQWVMVPGLGWTHRQTGEVRDAKPEAPVNRHELTSCPSCGRPSTVDHQRLCTTTPPAPAKKRQRPSRSKKKRTPEELEAARHRREEIDKLKRAREQVWYDLAPIDVVEGDPDLELHPPRELMPKAYVNGAVLERERLSGRGLPGSRLIVRAFPYDGARGGEPGLRASLFVIFERNGFRFRSEGVALRGPEECRAAAHALVEAADNWEAEHDER